MKDVPGLISENMEKFLTEARKWVGSPAWNEMLWVVRPGGPAILDQVEASLKLTTDNAWAQGRIYVLIGMYDS